MIRDKHLRWFGFLVCVLSICITTLIPRSVSSKEAGKLEPAPFTVRADILMELNLMRNGDTRLYPPQNEPTEADQNERGENEELVNRNFITLFLKGDIL